MPLNFGGQKRPRNFAHLRRRTDGERRNDLRKEEARRPARHPCDRNPVWPATATRPTPTIGSRPPAEDLLPAAACYRPPTTFRPLPFACRPAANSLSISPPALTGSLGGTACYQSTCTSCCLPRLPTPHFLCSAPTRGPPATTGDLELPTRCRPPLAGRLRTGPGWHGHLQAGTCGLVAMTSAQHAEGRQFDPGQVYCLGARRNSLRCKLRDAKRFPLRTRSVGIRLLGLVA